MGTIKFPRKRNPGAQVLDLFLFTSVFLFCLRFALFVCVFVINLFFLITFSSSICVFFFFFFILAATEAQTCVFFFLFICVFSFLYALCFFVCGFLFCFVFETSEAALNSSTSTNAAFARQHSSLHCNS